MTNFRGGKRKIRISHGNKKGGGEMKDTIMEQVKPVLDLLTPEQLAYFENWLDQKEQEYDNKTLSHQVLFVQLIAFLENNFPDAWSKGFMFLPDEYQLFQGINTPKMNDFFQHPDSTTIARASVLSPDVLDNYDFDPSLFDYTPPPPKGGSRRKKRTQKMKKINKMKQNKKNSIRSIYMKRSLTRSRGRTRGRSRSRGRTRTRRRGLKGGYIAEYSTPSSSNKKKKKKKNKKSITGKTNTSSTQSP